MTKENKDDAKPDKREASLKTFAPSIGLPSSAFETFWDESIADGNGNTVEECAAHGFTFAPSALRILFSERTVSNILSRSGYNQSQTPPVALSTKPVSIRSWPNVKNERETILNKWENERMSLKIEQPISSATSTVSTTETTSTVLTTTPNPRNGDTGKQMDRVEATATMTEEQRILERNRKGRERSMRTRQRNALQLKILEENVLYLTTENSLLRDIIAHLKSVYGEGTDGQSSLVNIDDHPEVAQGIIMGFTALLLCVQSRPLPYVPRPLRAAPSRHMAGNETEKAPTSKRQTNSHARVDLPVSSPTTPPNSHMLSPFPDDFELSVEELRMAPVLDIDELDTLLREHDNQKENE